MRRQRVTLVETEVSLPALPASYAREVVRSTHDARLRRRCPLAVFEGEEYDKVSELSFAFVVKERLGVWSEAAVAPSSMLSLSLSGLRIWRCLDGIELVIHLRGRPPQPCVIVAYVCV